MVSMEETFVKDKMCNDLIFLWGILQESILQMEKMRGLGWSQESEQGEFQVRQSLRNEGVDAWNSKDRGT